MGKKKIQEVSVSKKTIKQILQFFDEEPKDKKYITLMTYPIGSKSIIRILARNNNKCFINMDNEYFFLDIDKKEIKGFGSLFDAHITMGDIKKMLE